MVRFDSLKHRAALVAGGRTDPDDLASFDVRQVGVLRRWFPEIFPRALRSRPLLAYMDARGVWKIAVHETRP